MQGERRSRGAEGSGAWLGPVGSGTKDPVGKAGFNQSGPQDRKAGGNRDGRFKPK